MDAGGMGGPSAFLSLALLLAVPRDVSQQALRIAAPHPLLSPPLQAQDQDRIDVGWASVWVKSAAQWVTSILYCWTLIAPALFPGSLGGGPSFRLAFLIRHMGAEEGLA